MRMTNIYRLKKSSLFHNLQAALVETSNSIKYYHGSLHTEYRFMDDKCCYITMHCLYL